MTEVEVAELRYMVCRRLGLAESQDRADRLLASGYVQVADASFLIEVAAQLKCERVLSLAECFCLALAKRFACKALFARKDRELVKEMKKKPFDVEVAFLEDFSKV